MLWDSDVVPPWVVTLWATVTACCWPPPPWGWTAPPASPRAWGLVVVVGANGIPAAAAADCNMWSCIRCRGCSWCCVVRRSFILLITCPASPALLHLSHFTCLTSPWVLMRQSCCSLESATQTKDSSHTQHCIGPALLSIRCHCIIKTPGSRHGWFIYKRSCPNRNLVVPGELGERMSGSVELYDWMCVQS